MRKGATTDGFALSCYWFIVALRNEKGSYNIGTHKLYVTKIVALRNEKGSYNTAW